MLKLKPHTQSKAFSLLEMAVVLGIVGIVAGSFLTALSATDEQTSIIETKQRLDKIETALMAFYTANDRLPCPTPNNIQDSNVAFGYEHNPGGGPCTGAVPGGISEIHGGTANDRIWVGTLPTRTLGLPDSYMYDAWGSRLTYGIINALGQNTADFSTYNSTTPDNDIIIIDEEGDASSGVATNAAIVNNRLNVNVEVVYVLVSHGADRDGSFKKDGTSFGCNTGVPTLDAENCDYTLGGVRGATFRDMAIQDTSTANTNFYYDYIRWKTLDNFATQTTQINAALATGAGATLPICGLGQTIQSNGAGWACVNFTGSWNVVNVLARSGDTGGWMTIDLSGSVGNNAALVLLRLENATAGAVRVNFRSVGETDTSSYYAEITNGGGEIGYQVMETNASGQIQIDMNGNADLYLAGFF